MTLTAWQIESPAPLSYFDVETAPLWVCPQEGPCNGGISWLTAAPQFMSLEKLTDFPLITTRSTTRWLRKAILWN